MPKLVLLVPCERVLIDQQNRASLIALLEDFRLEIGEEMPENASIPLRWSIFTLWRRVESDAGKRFEQECDLIGPNGKRLFRASVEFEMEKPLHRATLNLSALPVMAVEGEYTIHVFLREVREGAERHEVGIYHFLVTPSVNRRLDTA